MYILPQMKLISETGRSNEVIGIRDGFLDRVDIAGQLEMGKILVTIRKVEGQPR